MGDSPYNAHWVVWGACGLLTSLNVCMTA